MPADPADYVDRFTSAEVCAAANITPATLKNWVSRRPAAVLLTKDDQAASAKGSPIQYSFRRVMQVAITAELVRLGWQPRPAAMVAITFTDLSWGGSAWIGDEPQHDPDARNPGQLFSTGRTFLVADEVPSDSLPGGKCIRVDDTTPLMSVVGTHHAAAVVDVSALWFSVRLRLGLPL
jgi:hypothetical protein